MTAAWSSAVTARTPAEGAPGRVVHANGPAHQYPNLGFGVCREIAVGSAQSAARYAPSRAGCLGRGTLGDVPVRIALVGDQNESYPSHRELNAVRGMLGDEIDTQWLPTDEQQVRDLAAFGGIWLTPGSPYADDGAAYDAITWAREHDVPFLGTCGGLQYAVIEYYRNVLHVSDASHAESGGEADSNVITVLACSLHGQERLVRPVAGTRFAKLMNDRPFVGMHYCNYGPNPAQLQRLIESGMVVEATADDADAEVLELPRNEFFILTLFQPQIGALAGKPLHPLLRDFVDCARARRAQGLRRCEQYTQRPLSDASPECATSAGCACG